MDNITEEHTSPPFFSASVITAMFFICVGGVVSFSLMIMWCRLWWCTTPEEPVKWLEVKCNTECPICLNSIDVGAKLICNHVFHISCIQMWIENKNICPLCRAIIQ